MPADGDRALDLLRLAEEVRRRHRPCRGDRRDLRQRGVVANHKKIRRLMREHDLQPKRRRRFVATTDSDHDGPIFPNRAKEGMAVDGSNQLWVSEITYVALADGFVYVAVILDASSRAVVCYAISRSIDARLTVAALRKPITTPSARTAEHAFRTFSWRLYRTLPYLR
jgi:putative transposase